VKRVKNFFEMFSIKANICIYSTNYRIVCKDHGVSHESLNSRPQGKLLTDEGGEIVGNDAQVKFKPHS